jgi:peroxiredoxin
MMIRFVVAMFAVVSALTSGSFVAATWAEDLEIGAKGPEFTAKGVDGKDYSLASLKGAKATVLAFTCNRCPVAIAYEDRFIDFQKKYADADVKFIAINVNTSDDLEAMKQRAEEKGFNFPYAYDASGDSARAYGARVTPHVFVLNAEGEIVYRGAFDDKQSEPTTPHVENVIKAVLQGKKPEVNETKPFGCGIKPAKK